MRKIIAIGGGEIGRPKKDKDGNYSGFYPIETTLIDKAILSSTGKKNPSLLFIPIASRDSTRYYEIVKTHFTNVGFSTVDPLYLSDKSLTKEHIKKSLLSYDAIYVGAGTTIRMMKTFRRLKIEPIIKKALDKGVVLSGLCAGSICWFNYGNSESRRFCEGTDKYIRVRGLGLIDALVSPHFNEDPDRRLKLKTIMKRTPGVAIALDNCAAIQVEGEEYRLIRSVSGAKANKIYWKNGEYIIEELPFDGRLRSLSELLNKAEGANEAAKSSR